MTLSFCKARLAPSHNFPLLFQVMHPYKKQMIFAVKLNITKLLIEQHGVYSFIAVIITREYVLHICFSVHDSTV